MLGDNVIIEDEKGEVIQQVEKKRGRPKKPVKEVVEVAKPKGRPRTDKPIAERRKVYDLKFSLKKYDLNENEIKKVIDYIDVIKNENN
jgi:hypothetical protein